MIKKKLLFITKYIKNFISFHFIKSIDSDDERNGTTCRELKTQNTSYRIVEESKRANSVLLLYAINIHNDNRIQTKYVFFISKLLYLNRCIRILKV